MAANVLVTRDGVIATVTLNRPDRRNSLSDEMLTDLGAAFAELRDDTSTRVVIVTGAAPVFSAGADAGHAKAATPEERRKLFLSRKSQFRRLFERSNALLENLEQATIAAVNGHAVGGGWGLALACDFRIAAAEAQFWTWGCRSGWAPPPASCAWSARRGPRRSSWVARATRRSRPRPGAS